MKLTWRTGLLLAATVTFAVLGAIALPDLKPAFFDFALAAFAASFLVR